MGKRDAMGKNYLLTLEPVTVLRNSDEINYKIKEIKQPSWFCRFQLF